MWPDRRLLDPIGIEIPVIQAPLAGANGSAMSAFGRQRPVISTFFG